ncbi:Zinc finger MYM-type protein [Arachis hypogaea]|nr:Zinc finger MYM-type protein [Arachis hypogaea]
MRPMIWKFPPNKRDEIRRAYIKVGPNQLILDNYPFSGDKSHRRFQASWFKLFPSWNWKKVNSGKECALLNHIGKGPNSFHHKALKSCDDLMKQSQHIDRLLHKQTSEEIEKNRIRLGASIDCIRWLTFQGCAYRGHDESQSSSNRARDESKKEQMAIVLRFVTLDGFVKERFFDLVHVTDTCATTLKKELISVLSHYNLQVENIRGQGYDGASNMRGEWNGLQALFLKDSPQAYYVHCFAHRLQLALVAASREVLQIHEFFTQLNSIVTIVSASSKRHDQLQEAQAIENANLVAQNELETGKGANQISTLQRAGDTRWSSHFNSICSLVKMFTATNIVLNIIEDGTTYAQRGEAYGVSKILLSFEFVFTLHLMKEIMGITNVLCQALQQQSQDILNAMHIVSTSKLLLQQLRDGGWCNFLANVKDFCEKHEIEVPNMSAQYVFGRGRSRQPSVTVEHHYRIDVFLATIDSQIQELNSRFNEQTIELLTLSCALDPKDNFKSFNIEEISKLAEKFYPLDFPSNELNILKSQLQHYQHDIPNHLKGIGTLSELCNKLQETGKSRTYHMVDRLIRLVLTLPVSTATTERAFSAMKIVKTRLRSKMADEFLADNLFESVASMEPSIGEEGLYVTFYDMSDHSNCIEVNVPYLSDDDTQHVDKLPDHTGIHLEKISYVGLRFDSL